MDRPTFHFNVHILDTDEGVAEVLARKPSDDRIRLSWGDKGENCNGIYADVRVTLSIEAAESLIAKLQAAVEEMKEKEGMPQ